MNLRMICKSFFYFSKMIFIKEEYDVIFAYKNHFNRNKDGGNPYLKPFIELCKKNNIKYQLFEETDLKGAFTNYPRNLNAVSLDFITLLQVILRKIFRLKKNGYKLDNHMPIDYMPRETRISNIIQIIFFRKFYSKVYITLAYSNSILWRTINENAVIADYQHGNRLNGNANYQQQYSNIITLVHGEGYRRILIESDKSHFFNNSNIINIGYYQSINYQNKKNNKTILLTLRQTPDMSLDETTKHFKNIEKLMEENKDFFLKNKYKILMKNHPRANHYLNLNYPFLTQLDNSVSIKDIISDVSIHMSFGSTVVFEVALAGIPTIFLDFSEMYTIQYTFYDCYHYPLTELNITSYQELEIVLKMLEDDKKFSNVSYLCYQWGKQYYSDFSEKEFLKLIGFK